MPSQIRKYEQEVRLVEEPHGDEGREAEQHAQQRIDDERTHGNQKRRREALGPFMQHVTGGVADAKITDVEHRHAAELAEEVGRLVHDHAGKRHQADQPTGNNDHVWLR